MACIRNATINIIDSTFKHNFANHHAGVFYIDESQTTVDGSLFINNSAALDGGVFYTYVHASDYIIRRSQFSENMAGDDGGVMLIGRLNCYVSIDETIFDFNSAGDRGGVVAIIASSMLMEINRTNIFNNTAQFGGVISACNSQVTLLDDSLFVTVDPVLPFCMFYEGDIQHFNMTAPWDPNFFRTTEPLTTIEPLTTTEPLTTNAQVMVTDPLPATVPLTTTETQTTTELLTSTQPLSTSEQLATTESVLITTTDQLDTIPLTTVTSNTAPPHTTSSDRGTHTSSRVTISTVPVDLLTTTSTTTTINSKPTGTTESLGEDIDHFTTRDQTTTTGLVPDKKNDVSVVIVDSKLTIILILSAVSLTVSLVLAVIMFVRVVLLYARKGKTKELKLAKNEFSEMGEFATHNIINPTRTFNDEEKDDLM